MRISEKGELSKVIGDLGSDERKLGFQVGVEQARPSFLLDARVRQILIERCLLGPRIAQCVEQTDLLPLRNLYPRVLDFFCGSTSPSVMDKQFFWMFLILKRIFHFQLSAKGDFPHTHSTS